MPPGNLTSDERIEAQALADEIASSVGHLRRGACDRLVSLVGRCAWPIPSVHMGVGERSAYDDWEVAGAYKIACDGGAELSIIHWRDASATGNHSMASAKRQRGSWALFVTEPTFLEIPIWFNRRLRFGYAKEVERAREQSGD